MSRLFNPDNAFFTFINKFIDTFWLGFLWCFLSLGMIFLAIFTGQQFIMNIAIVVCAVLVGPATTAIYYAMVKVIRRSRSYATREFFHSFKDNFRVAAPVSFGYSLFAYLMFIDFQYAGYLIGEGNTFGNIMFAIFVAGCVLAAISLVWIFPILSRFTVGCGTLLKNALMISTRHIVRSLLLVLIWVVPGYLCYLFRYFLLYVFVLIPLVPGLTALLRSFVIEPVLKKYTPGSEDDPEQTGVDEWYRE